MTDRLLGPMLAGEVSHTRELEFWRASATAESAERKRLATELAFARDLICELSQRPLRVEGQQKPDEEVQKHVDTVLSDMANNKVKPGQIDQLQRGIADASLRRAMAGRRRAYER